MPDELFIEVDPHIDVVLSGGRKTRGDAFPGQGQGEPVAPWLQGQQWIALLALHGNPLHSSFVLYRSFVFFVAR